MKKQGILFDLDGVLYVGDAAIPGAAEVIRWTREQNIPHRYLTNTTSRPRHAIVEKLLSMGIEVESGELLTPAIAAAGWLKHQVAGAIALFVPAATAAELDEFDQIAPDAESGADAVVLGDLGAAWDFTTLNRAFRLLMSNPRSTLLALGLTRYWRAEDGLRLDAGPFVRALEYASGREAVVVGKPAPSFFESAAESLGLPPEHLAVVGDDIRGDIQGAQNAGMHGLLVRTGKFSPADLDLGIAPDAVLHSIADLPAWWISQQD